MAATTATAGLLDAQRGQFVKKEVAIVQYATACG